MVHKVGVHSLTNSYKLKGSCNPEPHAVVRCLLCLLLVNRFHSVTTEQCFLL